MTAPFNFKTTDCSMRAADAMREMGWARRVVEEYEATFPGWLLGLMKADIAREMGASQHPWQDQLRIPNSYVEDAILDARPSLRWARRIYCHARRCHRGRREAARLASLALTVN